MSVELFLEACRIDTDDPQVTPEILNDLACAYELTRRGKAGRHGGEMPHAVTMLTAALGQISRFNPTHLPFGFGGPRLQSRRWVDVDRIELLMTQMIGLCHTTWDVQRVNFEAMAAVSEAASLGLIEKKDYDGWTPGMPSGSGMRTAVSATPYGLVRARQAAATPPQAPTYPWRKNEGSTQASAPATSVEVPAPTPMSALVETGSNVALLHSPPSQCQTAVMLQAQPVGTPTRAPSEDRYAWARQIELVRATNQVLGQDSGLNAGVLSRACRNGEIATNQKSGRASMVDTKSFIAWLGKSRELAKDELDQVRNAVIGEISNRC